MAMAASANHHLALSVSADHLIARYNLAVRTQCPTLTIPLDALYAAKPSYKIC